MRSRAGPESTCRPRWNGRLRHAPGSSTTASASSGNGPAAPTRPTRATGPSRARSGNITASSWSISWCCAAHRLQLPPATAVSPTATSSIRTIAGNSPGYASPTTPDFHHRSRAGKRVRESIMNVHAPALAEPHRFDEATSVFAGDVIGDLSRFPKKLSPKYFYDAKGSELFEQITVLPEYYPTRTELSILRERGGGIAQLIPQGAALVEFGAGATTKVRLLLERSRFAAYVPVDISGDFLQAQAEGLRRDFPQLAVYPVAADFTAPFALPDSVADMPKLGFFPGSTLGNFEPQEAQAFLRSARNILGRGAQMIIGVDLEKDERTLYDAYNDAAGVTARFNLNVLERINRELGGNFDLSGFIHRSIYDRDRHRIEMHLISRKAQSVRVLGHNFSFRPGESIHTENSYKYSLDRFTALARGSGWRVTESWTDKSAMFSVHAMVAED